jgi:hypothetical protein
MSQGKMGPFMVVSLHTRGPKSNGKLLQMAPIHFRPVSLAKLPLAPGRSALAFSARAEVLKDF